MKTVIHLPLNVKEGEGINLSEKYRVGNTFPVFVLTNSDGDVIKRWVGYYGSARFISALKSAFTDLTTIDERVANFQKEPTSQDALFLAGYYTEVKEYLKAIEYYRQARDLGGSNIIDYDYKIFTNYINAAWNSVIPFEDVLPVADTILLNKKGNNESILKVARFMGRLARKLGKTDKITKYIQAGIEATAQKSDENSRKQHNLLKIDYILYAEADTNKAINMKKAELGKGWESNPDKYYDFAEWCLERKINLIEAGKYALQTSKLATAGPFKGKTLKMTAEIYDALGDTKTAVRLMEAAVEQDPENDYYKTILNGFHNKLNN